MTYPVSDWEMGGGQVQVGDLNKSLTPLTQNFNPKSCDFLVLLVLG